MNKGRNIFLILMCLLCISVLTFLSVFQRGNRSGVVDDVRYVLENEDTVSFYEFTDEETKKNTEATVSEDDKFYYVSVDGYEYSYKMNKTDEEIVSLKNGKEVNSTLAYETYSKELFERILSYKETSGAVDGVIFEFKYKDTVKAYKFYFKEKGNVVSASVSEDNENWIIDVSGYKYSYTVEKSTGKVNAFIGSALTDSPEAFEIYSRDFFKQMMLGREKVLAIWQAVIVAVLVFAGGAVILYAEELWHLVYRKGEDEIPQWKDMNGIKYAGGGIIAAGVILLIVFIII